ncbi:MAG TPA: hypothetical protein VF104_00475 [Burkholderiales bacterium]
MISFQECLDLSGLTEDEAEILAEHENIPVMVAMEMGATLLQTPKGTYYLKCCIQDRLARAEHSGDRARAKHLDRVLLRFNQVHPVPRVL